MSETPPAYDAGENALIVRDAELVVGATTAERAQNVQNVMEQVRFFLDQPGATLDFNAKQREQARANLEHTNAVRARKNLPPEEFDESKYPAQLHILATTWDRLSRLFRLRVQLGEGQWMEDPQFPKHKAYTVQAIAYTSDGEEVGRSNQMCSFAENFSGRPRWTDSAKVMGTAETRARARAIRQALKFAIPYAFQVQTPEEMDPPAPPTDPGDGYVAAPQPVISEDIPSDAPIMRGGEDVNPQSRAEAPDPGPSRGPVDPEIARSVDAAEAQAQAAQAKATAAVAPFDTEPAAETESRTPPHPMSNEPYHDFDEPYNWTKSFYQGAIKGGFLPELSEDEWPPVWATLAVVLDRWTDEDRTRLVMHCKANPVPKDANPFAPWITAISAVDESVEKGETQ